MHLTRFDMEALQALHLNGEVDVTDEDVVRLARHHFAPDWGGALGHGRDYSYYPRVNLSLGRLRKLGLAESRPNDYDSGTWSYWRLTDHGTELARALVSAL